MIQYQCGHCRAEMESPDVMKEKVEACPSCGTLNRVPSAARFGGTVRCARCEKDFSHEDKVKLYNRELVCEECAAFLEDIEKVALPEATEEDLAVLPSRSVFSGWLACLAVPFCIALPLFCFRTLLVIWDALAALIGTDPIDIVASLPRVWEVAGYSYGIWVYVLFFRKKRIARIPIVAMFIVQGVCGLLFFLLEFGSGDTRGFVVGGGGGVLTIWCILWILYFLFSKRVKETFVNRGVI